MRRITICEGYTKSNRSFKLVLTHGGLYLYYPATGHQKRFNQEQYTEDSDFTSVKADLVGRGFRIGR